MIPVNEPLIEEDDVASVLEAVRSGWIASGEMIDRFEEGWAAACSRRFGIAVSNGSAALDLAFDCLDLQSGDEVILPTFTIISCALAVLRAGATPILVDADPKTWCMDVNQVRDKVTPRTKAILAVPIYGHPVDMDPLMRIADEHDVAIIEDAAEAHGAEYESRFRDTAGTWIRCGAFGLMSTFSFYANKVVTTGEGGMILTDEEGIAEKARRRRNLSFDAGRRFLHEEEGFNFRLTNLQAALGVSQISRLPDLVRRKQRTAQLYARMLSDLPGITLPFEAPWARSVYWMYGLVLEADARDNVMEALHRRNIETRPFFVGMHQQPVFARRGLFKGENFPIAEHLARQGLYLPSGLGLRDEEIEYVSATVREIILELD